MVFVTLQRYGISSKSQLLVKLVHANFGVCDLTKVWNF